jgi:hypothetical protein
VGWEEEEESLRRNWRGLRREEKGERANTWMAFMKLKL